MSFDADVIIVGGGLAGLSAAITANREGLSTIVLERGEYSGSKNVSGGRMYTHALLQLFPDALERAPLERPVTNETYEIYCEEEKKITFSFRHKTRNSYTVLRAKFDQWLAKEAENEGVLISYSTLVTNARRENDYVVIETNRGELKAPLVIDAGGITAPVSRFLGVKKLEPKTLMLGVKEVLDIKPDMDDDEGEARTIVGLIGNLKGGGFVYTNKDTLSVGVTIKVESLYNSNIPSHEIVERFRESLGLSGSILEYSAHLIPYYGYDKIGKIYDKNLILVGDAAGFLINDGFNIRGMDLAMGSGIIAGKSAKKIKELNDYSRTDIYYEMLKESFVLKDMKTALRSFSVLNEEEIFTKYPKVICNVLGQLFTVTSDGKERPINVLIKESKSENVNTTKMLTDIMRLFI
ncbi:NAD(P)/FAD-dependent oxidoreductase [Saccharolobus solfataricus]|uniref:Electron transfert oxidoreductase n=3 Tax=Saccharolobus solfataricus TaxID=2287 RepID=Q97V59_SACS2|nr:NAD(P)/FAD-dependent oxidoreductase [Saccharolobus solfataricus]AAK42886.1 Electron transfert oxidoreductase [Saccharolobus solfataricus P2]AKA72979.1 NAD(P)/FAD-dependent oxidoreductase [Saccharolobus solfataricus]AKA75678.1 NAD(P)/FAD-dependent oxidoreductase [Saccharolobus solfataricus]AKA78371.1 NAD(P)/FAD-dependent oxidoreductase [Saccharolobus solfataricus]AZF67490.1 NAD(P)/FAD-dependent oxidoreductase [Saccharolobus solfataricus]